MDNFPLLETSSGHQHYWSGTDASSPFGPSSVSSGKPEELISLNDLHALKVRGCFCVRSLIWLEPMSVLVGAQRVFSESWVMGCQSSYRNYTWCLSSLSVLLFCLAACATSKRATGSFRRAGWHFREEKKNSSGVARCKTEGIRVYQDVCEGMRKMKASAQALRGSSWTRREIKN